MAKCNVCIDFDEKMRPHGECENTGWPELYNLCPDHFREFRISHAQAKAYEAEQLLAEEQHKLYLVEVAMGLRSKPYPSTVVDSATPRRRDQYAKETPPSRVRARPSSQNNEVDLEELE